MPSRRELAYHRPAMKALHLVAAVLAIAASSAAAQTPANPRFGYARPAPPPLPGPIFGLPYFYEPYPVVIEREVVREVPVLVEPAAPPPEPREPYVIGKSYASLPGGCLKMIQSGASYFYCSGEWYRQVGEGSGALYKAVAMP